MPIGSRPKMNKKKRYDDDAPACQICDDVARWDLKEKIRRGLRERNLWAPSQSEDLVNAIFLAIDEKRGW